MIGVIYGVAWVLRQVKAAPQPRATGAGLAALASVPLGPEPLRPPRARRQRPRAARRRRAGRRPDPHLHEEEARAAGLVDEDGMLILPRRATAPPAARAQTADAARAPQLRAAAASRPARRPRRELALPAPRGVLDQLRAWTVRR